MKAALSQNPAQRVRVLLGALLLANLIAAGLVLYPPGGSAENLQQELTSLQVQIGQARARLDATGEQAVAVEAGREEGEQFLDQYFIGHRIVHSALLEELTGIAEQTGITSRGNGYTTDLIEGSDTLGMMTITANFEGTYRNLLNFVRAIDRSPSLLIIESLAVAPQPDSDLLTGSMRLNAFVQEPADPFSTGPAALPSDEEEPEPVAALTGEASR